MLTIAPAGPSPAASSPPENGELCFARTCYDHLAGYLGVSVTDALERQHLIDEEGGSFVLTAAGRRHLFDFGVDVDALSQRRRPLVRSCLDWTERRPHLAGALGAAMTQRMLEAGWVRPQRASRALTVTATGVTGLRRHFAVNLRGLAA